MVKMIRRSFDERPKDHIRNLFLGAMQHENGEVSLTFLMNGGFEIVSYERLAELNELIGRTLKNGKEEYNAFKNWHYTTVCEEREKEMEARGFKKQK